MIPILLVAIVALLLLVPSPGLGDEIVFKNGSTLQARVLESSGGEFIQLELQGGIIAFPWTEVQRVILGPETQVSSPLPPEISASSALVLEESSGRIMLEKNARERRPIASLTKLMTAVIILERGCLEDMVRVNKRATTMPGASLGLRPGQRVLLRDLLAALLVKSANDAAVAAAEHVCGSEEKFVKVMNEKALSLGLLDTHFCNCHGLDHPDHYSTAYDMALLSRYAMSLPFLVRCVKSKEVAVCLEGFARPKVWRNSNKFLGLYLGADGIKTGYTGEAGRCLVASALRGGHRLIAVLLNDKERWRDACELLEYGFSLFWRQKMEDFSPRGRLKARNMASEG